MDSESKHLYEFDSYRVDEAKQRLSRAGEQVPVGHKDFQVLLVLVQNRGETVGKDELLKKVWGLSADENYLAQSVSKLRKALTDSADDPRYIKTVPGEGYRFIGNVKELGPDIGQEGTESGAPASGSGVEGRRLIGRFVRFALTLGAALSVILLIFELRHRQVGSPNHEAGVRDYKDVSALSSPSLLAAQLRSSSWSDAEAREPYLDGLAKLKALNYSEAKDILLKAAASDPNDALVHAALAEAWAGVGSDPDATAEAKKALDLSKSLPPELRLLVEGVYSEMTNNWGEACKIYQHLWESSQNNLEYGLLLADAQKEAGRFPDAFSTLSALAKLPPPDQYDPRIEVQEADVAEYSQDYERERASAEAAAKRASALGANRIFAEAKTHQGWALTSLGQLGEAKKAFSAAYDSYAQAGEKAGVADALNGLADLLRLGGDLDASQEKYQESLAICRELEYQRMLVDNLCSMGDVLGDQEHPERAESLYQQCLEKSRQSGYWSGSVAALLSLAALSLDLRPAASAEARRYLDELEAQKPKGPWDLLALEVITARWRASSGKPADVALARNVLRSARVEAEKHSFVELAFESRLAYAETQIKSGEANQGWRELKELERDASAKGFRLFVRKAAKAGVP